MEKPKYNAIWEKKEDDIKYWRKKNGLNDINIDTNPEKLPDPSLKWVTSLIITSRRGERKSYSRNS